MTTPKIAYLDYMATTPVAPSVVEAMLPYLTDNFGNPASKNYYGHVAQAAIEKAREQVARCINTDAKNIIFTSGATESINLALKGAANFYRKSGDHIITLTTEHTATLAACKYLENNGFTVTYLTPMQNGLLDLEKLKEALRPTTILVSICHVNNEIGVVQDIEAIGALVNANGALLHIDAAQSIGKAVLDVTTSQAALISLSAHKSYGPKGVGALYIRPIPRLHLTPLNHGGGQEKNIRSGTLATHQIVGMGAAFNLMHENFKQNITNVITLQRALLSGIQKLDNIKINGDLKQRVPHNLSVTFKGIPGELLYNCLQSKIAVSSGSACNSHTIKVSHVLTALGVPFEDSNATIRYSIGHTTTLAEIETAVECTIDVVNKLRSNI